MVATLCDQPPGLLASALTVACLALAVILVLYMVLTGCGLPCRKKGNGEGMVGAHWDQAGTYGNTPDTLPAYGYSGYYESVPTPPWA